MVMTLYLVHTFLHSLVMARHLMKSFVVLSEFHILYEPYIVLKSQILQDFMVEFTIGKGDQEVTTK